MTDEQLVKRQALDLLIQTGNLYGSRYMECLKYAIEWSSLNINLSEPWVKTFFENYKEYDIKMREAGLK